MLFWDVLGGPVYSEDIVVDALMRRDINTVEYGAGHLKRSFMLSWWFGRIRGFHIGLKGVFCLLALFPHIWSNLSYPRVMKIFMYFFRSRLLPDKCMRGAISAIAWPIGLYLLLNCLFFLQLSLSEENLLSLVLCWDGDLRGRGAVLIWNRMSMLWGDGGEFLFRGFFW